MSNATSRRAAAAEATQPLSFNLILAEYRDFFEVALHSILFTRRVYPSALFDQQARWGVAAQRARHPDVQSYIDNALKHVLEEIGRVSARSSLAVRVRTTSEETRRKAELTP